MSYCSLKLALLVCVCSSSKLDLRRKLICPISRSNKSLKWRTQSKRSERRWFSESKLTVSSWTFSFLVSTLRRNYRLPTFTDFALLLILRILLIITAFLENVSDKIYGRSRHTYKEHERSLVSNNFDVIKIFRPTTSFVSP